MIMKFLIFPLFLLCLQGCITEMWVGNVYGENNEILWADVFMEEDRCKETTPNMVPEFEYIGAWDWDCTLHVRDNP
jgi:hypothetical protein